MSSGNDCFPAPVTMAPRTVTTLISPSVLNNNGVALLEAGRFVEAVSCFKKASAMMRTVITTHQNRIRGAKQLRAGSTSMYLLSGVQQSITTSENGAGSKRASPSSLGAEPWCDPPPRKRIRQISQMATTTLEFPPCLGRPLWVQSRSRPLTRRTHLSLLSLSATLLYNLGLCFHMVALRKRSMPEAKLVYQRALEFYKMPIDLIQCDRSPCIGLMRTSPIIAVSLHNMVQAYSTLEEHEVATRYRGQLAQALRLIVGGTLAHQQQEQGNYADIRYETFYMSFLSHSQANTSLAAAA